MSDGALHGDCHWVTGTFITQRPVLWPSVIVMKFRWPAMTQMIDINIVEIINNLISQSDGIGKIADPIMFLAS
ncbi:hypothetical protein [Salinivibrio socompensis]|uniref:hypothetical protein n=1 Tax=Salinivibrio socompensis TaxID=1510206 RepID=UPI00046EA17A|nr:hypothetical protein [Salinivibrio socompensis]